MPDDPYDLDRFVRAQGTDYIQAFYSISGIGEARAYLAHPVLGPRLMECAEAVLHHEALTASAIFGYPDDMKLRSSATLFASVSPAGSAFHRIIDKFFQGQPDERTLRLLQSQRRSASAGM